MAAFSNQTTNLKALSTALSDLCRRFIRTETLEVEARGGDEQNEHQKRKAEADEFLDSLITRVDTVDAALCKSTEHLLQIMTGRGKPSRMTATELAQVLVSLHDIHARQISRFSLLLGDTSLALPTSDQNVIVRTAGMEKSPKSGNTPHHWLMGMPLEKVVETDNETDRASIASMRSISFCHTPSGKVPSTPQTPSINGLHLSASTKKILSHSTRFDSPEVNASGKAGHDSGSESFRQQDSSVSLREDQDQLHNTTRMSHDSHEGSDSLFRHLCDTSMEGEHYSKNASTDMAHSIGQSTPETVERLKTNGGNGKEETTIQSMLGEYSDDEDEATTLCPTVVANPSYEGEKFEKAESKQSNPTPQKDNYGRSRIFRNLNDLTGSQVVVQTESSPSQTMLTMDNTVFLNENDLVSQSSRINCDSRLRDDVASLGEETPVLDRYRIIEDDNSIGFKILPNQRGSQRKIASAVSCTAPGDEGGIPRSVRFREKQEDADCGPSNSFRKTPYRNLDAGGAHGETSRWNGSSSPDELGSTLNKENSAENVTLPKAHHSKTPGDKSKRVLFQEEHKRSVAFQSPTNTRIGGQRFQKTPRPTAFPSDQVEERKEETLRFEADLDFETFTPLKDKTQVYRKTPHQKVIQKLSIESLKFAPGAQFQASTPSTLGRKAYRKTPFVTVSSDEEPDAVTPMKYFSGRSKEFATLTPKLRSGEAIRKSPYQRNLWATASPSGRDYHDDNREENQTIASPLSLASSISGITWNYTDNQRELFPCEERAGSGPNKNSKKCDLPGDERKSSVMQKIGEDEYEAGELKQFSLDEMNAAITHLNGAAFLRRESGDLNLQFLDAEAYKILRNVGFKRRKARGVLLALCHWARLTLREETELGTSSHYFEVARCEAH